MYKIYWLLPRKVICVELSEIVTVEEMRIINQSLVREYLNAAKTEVQIVVCGNNVKSLPVQIGELITITRQLAAHPKLGHSVYVNMTHPLLAFVANAVTAGLGQAYTMVNTVSDAYVVLENMGKI